MESVALSEMCGSLFLSQILIETKNAGLAVLQTERVIWLWEIERKQLIFIV